VGKDAQERGKGTTLFCVWDAKVEASFVNSVKGSLYVSLLFEGDLEIATVLWSGLRKQCET
jgi:hypothetical protein